MAIYKSDEKLKIKKELKELQDSGEAPKWLKWFSLCMMREGYLGENETPKQRYRAIAKKAASYLPKDNAVWEEKFFQLMWLNWMSPSTPIMGNLSTDRGMAVSCSASYVDDTMWDIAFTNYEISILSSQGFGTAAHLNVRAGNQPIKAGGVTNPTRDWVEAIWHVQNKVNQGSLRRGSTAIYLDFWQGDLRNILPMLETHDKLHLGVVCDDSVKAALEAGDEKAIEIYRDILTWRARKGKPYVIFISNAQRQDPECYKKLNLSSKHSNLCLSAETLVTTSEGPKRIASLVGQNVQIFDGKTWVSNSNFRQTGLEELHRVHLSDGSFVDATAYHDWYVKPIDKRESQVKKYHKLKTHQLLPGHKLKYHLEQSHGQVELISAYAKGFLLAEGTSAKVSHGSESQIYKPICWVYRPKESVLDRLITSLYETPPSENIRGDSKLEIKAVLDSTNDRYSITGLPSRRDLTPWCREFKTNLPQEFLTWTKESKLNFLAGLFDGDGTYMKTNGGYQLGSIHRTFLNDIQIMLKTLGIRSNISLMRAAGEIDFNDGYGSYLTKDMWRITISSYFGYLFSEMIKFSRVPQYQAKKPNRFCADFNRVVSVEKLEGIHPVFCTEVESTHKFALTQGVITGNCTEIFLHTDSEHTLSCVLSSMCGHTFDEWKDTDAVFNATVFLDCIAQDLIERGSKIRGLERVVASTKKGRALGLGLLGFHSYLQQHMIPFDDLRARFHNQIIFEHLQKESTRASKFLAEWLGEPEWCLGTGLRNTHLSAIAPNTSSAFFSGGQSQGIEPLVANVFTQKLSKVGAVDRMPAQLVKILKAKGHYNSEVINSIVDNKGSVQHLEFLTPDEKAVFKTAYELNQKVLIDLAEQRQKYIDQGQSLNLFFDANEDEVWIHEVHKYAFQQKLLKSLYYVRTMAGISASKDDSCLSCEG